MLGWLWFWGSWVRQCAVLGATINADSPVTGSRVDAASGYLMIETSDRGYGRRGALF